MRIHVLPTVNETKAEELLHKTVIVIDVLRATSTMLTALMNGCKEIYPVETVQQAKLLQQDGELLGGERNCKKIPGFDLGNSPLEYTKKAVNGNKLIFTTTNGTRCIQKSGKADHILLGSLLNAKACAHKAAELKKDVVIICSGTQDVYALEDGLCAGLIMDQLASLLGTAGSSSLPFEVNDFGLSMLHAYREVQSSVTDTLLSCANGKRLTKLGFQDDVLYCAHVNLFDAAPIVRGGVLTLPANTGLTQF